MTDIVAALLGAFLKLSIANRNRQIMQIFDSAFGSKSYALKSNNNEALKYQSDLVNISALNAVQKIYPFLVLKQKQAELLLKLGRAKLLDDYQDRVITCSKLKQECQLLNKRGA